MSPKNLSLFCFCFFFLSSFFSFFFISFGNAASCSAVYGTYSYDLSPLTKTGGANWQATSAGGSNATYLFNVCAACTCSGCSSVSQTTVCQKTATANFSCGVLTAQSFAPITPLSGNGQGVSVVYSKGNVSGSCPNQSQSRQTTLYVLCTSGTPTVYPAVQTTPCAYNITMLHSAGCGKRVNPPPPPPPTTSASKTASSSKTANPSSSTSGPPGPPGPPSNGGGFDKGWIFVIIVFATLIIYFIAGGIWRWKKEGATGLDVIPNQDFWKDLPILVKDGMVFTWVKVKGLANRGGGEGYSKI